MPKVGAGHLITLPWARRHEGALNRSGSDRCPSPEIKCYSPIPLEYWTADKVALKIDGIICSGVDVEEALC